MSDVKGFPRVTIMIPTFNQAEFIAEALKSALSQTYSALEVIVGDDASSDDTQKIVQEFLHDTRVRYVRRTKNIGRVANYRDLLYSQATGEYVVNLDGDDYYTDPLFVESAVAALRKSKDIVIVAARTEWKTARRCFVSATPGARVLSGLRVLSRLPRRACHFQHMATLYRRDRACELDFYRSGSNSSDWESLYRLASTGNVAFVDRVVGVWRQHGSNATRTVALSRIVENLMIWKSVFDTAVQHGMSAWFARVLRGRCESYFLGGYCAQLSLSGSAEVFALLRSYLKGSAFGFFGLLLSPLGLFRLLLSLSGYYRRRA